MTKRWEERFENFEKAFDEFKNALENKQLSFLELAGLIKLFEICFELAWKVMKDILKTEGLLENESMSSPRRVIKIAVQNNFLKEDSGKLWLKALEDRNFLVHTYDEIFARKSEEQIRNIYFLFLDDFYKECKELQKKGF